MSDPNCIECARLRKVNEKVVVDLDEMKAERDRLKDALQWYAAIVERASCSVDVNTISLSQPDAVIAQRILIKDGGICARNALEGKP